MSDLLRTEDLAPPRPRPARAWKNRMWSAGVVRFVGGGARGPGLWLAQLTYPSAEVAETRALEWLRQHEAHGFPFGEVRWIEAMPDEGGA